MSNRGAKNKSVRKHAPRQASERLCLLVLGMHRGGTSAFAGTLSHLGAALPKTLMPAADENPRGFWESMALMKFHDRLLAAAGGRWSDFDPFDPGWLGSAEADAFATELKTLLAAEFGDSRIMLVKDPRICRLLPFWLEQLEALSISPRLVIATRNPLEVAASLDHRNGFALAESQLIWLRHMLDAEKASRGQKRIAVPYEDLLTDWHSVVARVTGQLSLKLPKPTTGVRRKVDAFLTGDLRHHRNSDEELFARSDVLEWVKTTHAALREISRDGDRATEASRQLDTVRREFDIACSTFRALVKRASSVATVRQKQAEDDLAEAEIKAAQALSRAEQAESEAAAQARKVTAAVAQAKHAESNLAAQAQKAAAAVTRAERAESDLAAQAQKAAAAVARAEHAESDLAAQVRKVAAAVARAEHAESDLAAQARKVAAAVARAVDAEAAELEVSRERNAIYASTSWGVTQPLRQVASKMPPGLRRSLRHAGHNTLWLVALRFQRLRQRRELAVFFDGKWYLRTYPDVAAAGVDPLSHYLSVGWTEGRDPGPSFSTRQYLADNPDLAGRGVNPLLHYLQFGASEGRPLHPNSVDSYANWISKREALTESKLADLRCRGSKLPVQPKISILMPTYNTEPDLLRHTIESVLAQTYDNWELCIADDGSSLHGLHQQLRSYQEREPRIKLTLRETNGGITLATNSALELATGEWVAMLDHDDVLAPHALFHVAATINARPDAQLIYSDEDKIDLAGERRDPYFKPDFSLELFRSQNYMNHLTVHRRENVEAVGGWRAGFEGSQDYDLNLRILERIDRASICHIPEVLYHWRITPGSTALAGNQKGYAYAAGLRALQEHAERLDLPARVEKVPGVPFYRTRFSVPKPVPSVSIIIPTRDRADLLHMSVGSILNQTTYERFEILIVDNGSVKPETFQFFAEATRDARVRLLDYPHPFNFSAINNFAARHAQGAILALVNNDVEVISPDWLDEMVSWAVQPEIGCVGAKLYYPNNRIQHGGVILGIGGVAGHAHKHYPPEHPGHFGRLKLAQNYSAVTGACLAVRSSVYREVNGLDESLAVAFNDIDFCLKVREAGYRNVWTPFAELRHHESPSRGHENTAEKRQRFAEEVQLMMNKWGQVLDSDPFYSPHLTRDREDFSIRR